MLLVFSKCYYCFDELCECVYSKSSLDLAFRRPEGIKREGFKTNSALNFQVNTETYKLNND